jgi:hypothetical protein
VPLEFGVTAPSVPAGGGLIAGYGGSPGIKGPGSLQTGTGVSGLILVEVMDPKAALATTAGALPLIPQRAGQIDRKMDDGYPGAGYVQAYGVGASCFTSAAANTYADSVRSKDCGLIYRMAD